MSSQFMNTINLKDIEGIKTKLASDIKENKKVGPSLVEELEALLKLDNVDVLNLTLQYIADLCKNENNRKLLTKNEVIQPTLQLISNGSDSVEVIYQSFRALGNLCFENDEARKIIDKNGLEVVIKWISSNTKEKCDKVITVACGCLLNILMSNDELQKESIKLDVLNVLEKVIKNYIREFDKFEDCFTHVFLILNAISEHFVDEWFSESLCTLIVDILRISNNPEISVFCLELLRFQAENNEIKTWLSEKGTCELIFNLVQKYKDHVTDEDSRSILKMACDLIVLIITGDESMIKLYDNANGTVYKQMTTWLNSEDVDLLSTGILVMGNFARKDSHCIQMVNNGLGNQLLDIFKKHNTPESDIRLQHALLSTLRNLSIPVVNKSKLIDANLVGIMLPLIKTNQSLVVFKLLGTFRMIIDGQENTAQELINKKEFIERIVYWWQNSDHLGVHGESSRLLSSLIKNCRSSSFSVLLSVKDSIKCIVEMCSSIHPVMQNEAYIALNILIMNYFIPEEKSKCSTKSPCTDIENINLSVQNCSGSCKESLSDLLVNAEIGKHLSFVLSKYGENMDIEIVENILTLLEQLMKMKLIISHLKDCKLSEALTLLLKNKKVCIFTEKMSKILNTLEKNC